MVPEKTVSVASPVMAKNDAIAADNQRLLDSLGILGVNMMSSPGSGKTTLLEALARKLGPALAVIEGDVQTRRDAERLERVGCRAYQIETRGACHLDAQAVRTAIDALELDKNPCRILVIENVGNLICPSGYLLGERLRVGLLSVAEGDDKILKYPALFSRIDDLLVSKIDLLPFLEFDVARAIAECRSLRAEIEVFPLSAKTGAGIDPFCAHLLAMTGAITGCE